MINFFRKIHFCTSLPVTRFDWKTIQPLWHGRCLKNFNLISPNRLAGNVLTRICSRRYIPQIENFRWKSEVEFFRFHYTFLQRKGITARSLNHLERWERKIRKTTMKTIIMNMRRTEETWKYFFWSIARACHDEKRRWVLVIC